MASGRFAMAAARVPMLPVSEIAARLDLRLQASRLVPWSRWVTPVVGGVVRKRFDTRFFVAAVPPGQDPSHDDHEATASLWLTPRAALLRYWEGGIELAPELCDNRIVTARCRLLRPHHEGRPDGRE